MWAYIFLQNYNTNNDDDDDDDYDNDDDFIWKHNPCNKFWELTSFV